MESQRAGPEPRPRTRREHRSGREPHRPGRESERVVGDRRSPGPAGRRLATVRAQRPLWPQGLDLSGSAAAVDFADEASGRATTARDERMASYGRMHYAGAIRRRHVQSAAVRSVGYDADNWVLQAEYTGGMVYN